jgi:hypothetical protein
VTSLHDQHRTGRKLHDAISPAANQTLIQCRMSCGAYHQEFGVYLDREVDNITHGMASDYMGVQLDLALVSRRPRTLNDPVVSAQCLSLRELLR